jgi:hypothetical protein
MSNLIRDETVEEVSGSPDLAAQGMHHRARKHEVFSKDPCFSHFKKNLALSIFFEAPP